MTHYLKGDDNKRIIQRKESNRHVEAVLKALDILECFDTKPRLGIKEIIRMTGMTRSRIMRLAGTLESRGYLQFDSEKGEHHLGSRFITLTKVFSEGNNFISISRPVMNILVKRTGESAFLDVINGLERICIAREEGIHPIRYSGKEGDRKELHAGAAGKVLLAFSPPELAKNVMKAGILDRLTESTITNTGSLQSEIERIRKLGYAVSMGERVKDAFSLAAPVLDRNGRCHAAIGISGPIHRFTLEVRAAYIEAVVNAAGQISAALGWDAPMDTRRGDTGKSSKNKKIKLP